MAHTKLFDKKTEVVKEWKFTDAQLLKITSERPAVKPGQKIVSPKFDFKSDLLRVVPDKFTAIELLRPEIFWPQYFCHPIYRVRKNQKNLTAMEWNRFIYAIEAMADTDMPSPRYQEFVQIHIDAMTTMAGMAWGAHSGINFLTWHREYLAKFEARLLAINPLVTLPYWNWIVDRNIPSALNNSSDFSRWGITRGGSFNGSPIANATDLANLMTNTIFATFSSTLEASPFHNLIHFLVGGTMQTASSPADPLFWLHHAFLDKLFADWEQLHPTGVHPNPTQILQPPPIMTRTNTQVWSTTSLGYIYQV